VPATRLVGSEWLCESCFRGEPVEPTNYKSLVERAGATFIRLRGGAVFFSDGNSGRTLSLYLAACRSIADVQFALKADREQVHEFGPWEKADHGRIHTQRLS
jgi:hypothetical protein